MAERTIEAGGVALCTEPFGTETDPPVLLIMGVGGSMLWWDEEFCRMLAERGRFVIRYDHRDTGRSTAYEPGQPGYHGWDLILDALRVLDGYGLPAAHLVGVSAGAAFAQVLALEFPSRVLSLVLISSSPATPGDRGLPPPTEEFGRWVAGAVVDWSSRDSVIDHLVSYSRLLNGSERPFDEHAARQLVERDAQRARNVASLQNHDLIVDDGRQYGPLSSVRAPTLVIHGTADPLFPLAHGEALANAIPGAQFVCLDGAGHGVDRRDWETIAQVILDHTRSASE